MFDTIIRGGNVVDGTGAAPRVADVAILNGLIAEVGKVSGRARKEINADGVLVTPGWIDAHTHYDGQVTWDERLEGSSANGVTSVVMGNCGVGFAPVRPGGVGSLIELMEGVEDIPGTALYEGMPWGQWETFPEYLSFLDTRKWSVDVSAQLAHGALRFYVMGERAVSRENATAEDLASMARIAQEAVEAGAVGFSTSRIIVHRSMSGHSVPGTFAAEEELAAIAKGLRAGGGAVLQAIPSNTTGQAPGLEPEHSSLLQELALFARISRNNNLPVVFTAMQIPGAPEMWRDVLATAAVENARGARLSPMVAPRAVTMLTTLQGYHRFMRRPTYLRLADLPHDDLVRELHRPEIKATILAERQEVPHPQPGAMENLLPGFFEQTLPLTFRMVDPLDYEPPMDQSLAAQATAQGRDLMEFLYEFLLEDNGRSVGMFLGSNYVDGNLNSSREMLIDANTVIGLSDAGAHVNFISDMSFPTFNLTHWVRDRTRGPRLPLELIVKKLTALPAGLFGLTDRGTLTPGKRADINVIDLAKLHTAVPRLHNDLPAGGSRFLQPSTGYLATIVRGECTRENDKDTGARPGRVARPIH
jgi:N-acyl-D-amino-acid deacylase